MMTSRSAASSQPRSSDSTIFLLSVGFLALFIAYAMYVSFTKTAALTWPYDPDHFRDIAATETVLQHGLGLDPYYQGERWWYNPTLPSLVAALAAYSGLDVPMLYARAGTFLNILAPITFFALVRRTSGGFVAAAAILAYIYVTPRGTQAWQTATYSPWLFAGTFAQPLFYCTLIAIGVMWRNSTIRHRLLVGVGLGLTLLTHTGPAMLLMGILVCEALARGLRPGKFVPTVRIAVPEAAVIAITSIVVAAPLLLPLVLHYKLHILNWYPIEWSYELLDLHRVADLANTHATPATFLALVGGWRFWSDSNGPSDRRLLTFWTIANVLLLLIGYVRQLDPLFGGFLPAVVPQFHFLSYLRALMAVFAGYGLLALAEWLQHALGRTFLGARRLPSATTVGFCLLFIASVAAMPRLAKRDDFGRPVTDAMAFAAQTERVAAYNWVRANLDANAVVLAPDDLAQTVIGVAGKRVVVVDRYFSNPYASHEARSQAREAMYKSLRESDRESFCRQAEKYDVSWLADHPVDWPRLAALGWVRPLFSSEEIVIAKVTCP